jgi:hypothetical protein|tara:strand:+ start:89 stop:580 length:492 start_codon:yes stop_codon:yes gene_type:complete
MSVAKVDGFGVRSIGDGYLANQEERKRFVRMYAGSAVALGDTVCFSFTNTEPSNGYGNVVVPANTGTTTDSCEMRVGIGIAVEAISANELGRIQVAGMCDVAKVVTGSAAPGEPLMVHSADGNLIVHSANEVNIVAIHVKDSTAASPSGDPSSSVFLLNPANL